MYEFYWLGYNTSLASYACGVEGEARPVSIKIQKGHENYCFFTVSGPHAGTCGRVWAESDHRGTFRFSTAGFSIYQETDVVMLSLQKRMIWSVYPRYGGIERYAAECGAGYPLQHQPPSYTIEGNTVFIVRKY